MGESTASLALKAAAWGLLSAISLVIGATIGVVRNPSKEIRAMLMAYGSGALIEALSIELFAHIVSIALGSSHRRLAGVGALSHRRLAGGGDGEEKKELVYVAMAMALIGGSCFAFMNKVLNNAGGYARHASSLKTYVEKRRLIFYGRLAAKLKLVPMFGDCLSSQELRELASKMKKDFFEEGEVIFSDDEMSSPIYFLLSGTVRIDVVHDETPGERADAGVVGARSAPSATAIDCGRSTYRLTTLADVDENVETLMVHRHQLFGELMYMTGKPVKAQAVASTDSCALKLLAHDFIDLLEGNEKIRLFFARSAAEGMKHTKLLQEASDACMGRMVDIMTEVIFSTDELIFENVDEHTPVYYLVLGHVELTYYSGSEASEASQRTIVRPGSLFGTDNLISGTDVSVLAVATDRALALRLRRDDINRFCAEDVSLASSLNKARTMGTMELLTLPVDKPVPPLILAPNAPALTINGCDAPPKRISFEEITHCEVEDIDLPGQVEPPVRQVSDKSSSIDFREASKQTSSSCSDPIAFSGTRRRTSLLVRHPSGAGRSSSKMSRISFRDGDTEPAEPMLLRLSIPDHEPNGDVPETQRFTSAMGLMDTEEHLPGRTLSKSRDKSIRASSKRVSIPTMSQTLSQAAIGSVEVTDEEILEADEDEDDNATDGGTEHSAPHGGGHNNSHAAIMIWLGILIDAIPESVVLGILASTSSTGSLLTFVIGVFLANLPEAMSSSGTMHNCGIHPRRIMTMWFSIVLLTGVGAAVGAIVFPPGSEDEEGSQYAIVAIEGMCGGAMLTMIANTALPEAFEQGGDVVGLSTLSGFLSALFVSVVSA
jgi:CRP-like cAMP-binding protein/zinc transporter ZupT